MERKPVVSVTSADLRRDTFRCPGKGGQNVNKRDTGVRYTHAPSGAVGKSCDHREQARNSREAFLRMAHSPEFTRWIRAETLRRAGQTVPETPAEIQARVDAEIATAEATGQLIIETFEEPANA